MDVRSDVDRSLCEVLERRLGAAGFDLVAAGPVAPYNASVNVAWRLATPHGDETTVVLVGGGRPVWEAFSRALRENRDLARLTDPLDTWAEGVIRTVVSASVRVVDFRPIRRPPPEGVAGQRLAALLGLAAVAPSHLSAHPVLGPWFGLRAAAVIDEVWSGPVPDPATQPCFGCPAPCADALAVVEGRSQDDATWRSWLAVRDACPVGREFRYGDGQLRYHFTKDRSILTRIVGQE